MSNNNKSETQPADIIEEVIPGKNKDYVNKSTHQNNGNNLEQSTQAVHQTLKESKRSIARSSDEAIDLFALYFQALTDTHEQTAQATKAIIENYREYQKQVIGSFESVITPYLENMYIQFLNNREFYIRIPEISSRIAGNYVKNAIEFSRLLNDVIFSNMVYNRNTANKANEQSNYVIEIAKNNVSSSSVSKGRMSKIEVDDGRNSDENTTNVKATFSCEKCGQTFSLRQELKEHSSLAH